VETRVAALAFFFRAWPAAFTAEPAEVAARFAEVLASEPSAFAAFFVRVAAAFLAASDRCWRFSCERS
jgi:hypothetical protein